MQESDAPSWQVDAGDVVGHEPREPMQLILDGRLEAAWGLLRDQPRLVSLGFVPTPFGHKMAGRLPIHTFVLCGPSIG